MRLASFKCPECGATLKGDSGATSVTCDYCGTVSAVQRRAGLLQTRVPHRGPSHLPVATQMRSAAWKRGWLIAMTLSLGFTVLMAVAIRFTQRHPPSQTAQPSQAGQPSPVRPSWWVASQRVILTDVNGDRSPDLIAAAASSTSTPPGYFLVALDGNNGHLLWRSKPYTPDTGSWGTLVVARDAVVVIRRGGQLVGFDLDSGKRRFTSQLPEQARRVCGDPGGFVVKTADGGRVRVDVASGAVSTAPAGSDCPPGSVASVYYHSTDPAVTTLPAPDKPLDGVAVEWGLQRTGQPVAVGLGGRAVGTHVASVVAYEPATGVVRWKAELPRTNQLSAPPGAPPGAAVTGDAVLVVYNPNGNGSWATKGSRLAAFSLADGTRRWDVNVPLSRDNATGVGVAGNRVYVLAHQLDAFSLENGHLLFTAP